MRIGWWALVAVGLGGCGSFGGNAAGDGGIGGPALGAAGGYVVGVPRGKDVDEVAAVDASKEAETLPAKADGAEKASTADLNGDGFVTLDEVIAMHDAGMSAAEQIARLKASGDRFGLTRWQEQYLRDRGVEKAVVEAMRAAQ